MDIIFVTFYACKLIKTIVVKDIVHRKAAKSAKETIGAAIEVQLLTYLKLSDLKLGILINFNVPILKEGIKRIVNNL